MYNIKIAFNAYTINEAVGNMLHITQTSRDDLMRQERTRFDDVEYVRAIFDIARISAAPMAAIQIIAISLYLRM